MQRSMIDPNDPLHEEVSKLSTEQLMKMFPPETVAPLPASPAEPSEEELKDGEMRIAKFLRNDPAKRDELLKKVRSLR